MSDLRNANSWNRASRQAIWLCLVVPAGLLVGYSLLARVLVRREIPAAASAPPQSARRSTPLPSAPPPAPAARIPAEWARRIDAYDRAADAGEVAVLTRLLDSQGLFIDVNGELRDRAGYVGDLAREGRDVSEVASVSLGLRILGEVAIESGTRETVRVANFQTARWRTRYTRVWLRRGGSWVMAAEQSTALPFWPTANRARGEE